MFTPSLRIPTPPSRLCSPGSSALQLITSLEHRTANHWSEAALSLAADRETADLDGSVLKHLALASYLRKSAHAEVYKNRYTPDELVQLIPSPECKSQVEAALERSWSVLAPGVSRQGEKLLGPLPAKVLRQLQAGPAALHEALLGDSLAVRIRPKESFQDALTALESGQSKLAREKPRLARWVSGGLTLGALALAPQLAIPLLQLLAGAATGWMAASWNESIVHDKIAHCPDLDGHVKASHKDQKPTLVSQLQSKGPKWLGQALERSWFGHTKIHHYRTYLKDFATQFRSREEQQKVDAYLAKNNREDLIDEEYGASIGWNGYAKFLGLAAPSSALTFGAASLLGAGPLFALGMAAPLLAYPLFSMVYHRYTHMPARQALQQAPFPLRHLLQTDLSRFITRHHFVHHMEDSVNFNLMPGADFLRGKAVKPRVAHLEELRRLGVLY